MESGVGGAVGIGGEYGISLPKGEGFLMLFFTANVVWCN